MRRWSPTDKLGHRSVVRAFYRRPGKRILDICVGSILAVITLPIQAAVGGLVWGKLGRPVLFRQSRPGLDAQPFQMLKFRTMTDARGPDGVLLPDAERLPRTGQLLRSTSLDELPELWNVIKGDMSLVGPRPLLMRYLPRYSKLQMRRHEVRPGITGLAQVCGRNNQEWEAKFELDVDYVERVSLCLDLRILWLTVWKVIRRDDVNMLGHATAPEFHGTEPPAC